VQYGIAVGSIISIGSHSDTVIPTLGKGSMHTQTGTLEPFIELSSLATGFISTPAILIGKTLCIVATDAVTICNEDATPRVATLQGASATGLANVNAG
jgi:hypothetical protein